ncbi:MAG TPA: HU family DNA-binding protein [Victivallales bacterium]|nr:HU family DNA-binding protein [Victivallales bacterium]
MTKRDFVVKIASETGLTQMQVADVVQRTLDYLSNEMSNGRGVELRNFGVFELKVRKERKGRNPNKPTNEVIIPERVVVKFRPGKELKSRVEQIKPARIKRQAKR